MEAQVHELEAAWSSKDVWNVDDVGDDDERVEALLIKPLQKK